MQTSTYHFVMNKITILAISAVFVASILTITAFEAEAIPDKTDPVAEAIDRLTEVMTTTTTQGPQGEQGEQGETGEQGEQGEASSFNSYWLNDSAGSGEERLTLLCDVGDKILAGSVETSNLAIIQEDRPVFDQGANSDQEGWKASIASQSGSPAVRVWAHCLIP